MGLDRACIEELWGHGGIVWSARGAFPLTQPIPVRVCLYPVEAGDVLPVKGLRKGVFQQVGVGTGVLFNLSAVAVGEMPELPP